MHFCVTRWARPVMQSWGWSRTVNTSDCKHASLYADVQFWVQRWARPVMQSWGWSRTVNTCSERGGSISTQSKQARFHGGARTGIRNEYASMPSCSKHHRKGFLLRPFLDNNRGNSSGRRKHCRRCWEAPCELASRPNRANN
eukprot:1157633-Pelagomonas_calceolata.AAC.5